MRFIETAIPGVWVVEPEPMPDERGFFARLFSRDEFEARGLNPALAQSSVSFNAKRGTLRGMHWQAAPHAEAKLVRCTRGAIFDVALDLRERSASRLRWHGVELSADNRRMLYIPEGFAHGFLTLEDHTNVFYLMSEFYAPEYARGFRWDDPAFKISWPDTPEVISERDASYADFSMELLESK